MGAGAAEMGGGGRGAQEAPGSMLCPSSRLFRRSVPAGRGQTHRHEPLLTTERGRVWAQACATTTEGGVLPVTERPPQRWPQPGLCRRGEHRGRPGESASRQPRADKPGQGGVLEPDPGCSSDSFPGNALDSNRSRTETICEPRSGGPPCRGVAQKNRVQWVLWVPVGGAPGRARSLPLHRVRVQAGPGPPPRPWTRRWQTTSDTPSKF